MTKHRLYPWALAAFLILFMVYPLSHVLLRAVIVGGEPSLSFLLLMISTEYYREALFNSLNLAIVVTLLCSLIAYPLAFILARYRFRGSGWVHSLLLLPLVIPPFVGALGFRQLFSRFGSVNVLLLNLGIIDSPINWLGAGGVLGVIVLQTIHLVPILYLSISASLQNAHQALEEAALMAGASRWRTARKIIVPLSFPGWFAGAVLVFIGSFTDLGTPLIFEYRKTISVQIYNMLADVNENPVGYSFILFTCMLCISLFLLSKASLLSGAFAHHGRSREGRLAHKLSPKREVLCQIAFFTYAFAAIVPQISVILIALSDEWFMSVLPGRWTISHFIEVLQHPMTSRSLFNSLWLSFTASILTVVIGFLTAYLIVRVGGVTGVVFESLSIVPLAVPGIAFAFGYIGAFSGTILDNRINPFPLLIAAYVVRRMPAMVRSASAGLQEASRSLEDAGLMVGASPWHISRKIVFPLIGKHLFVGAILTFAYSMIEVSDGLLLALEERFYPISKAIYALMGRPDGMEVAAALGVIVMLVMTGAFFLAERLTAQSALKRSIMAIGFSAALLASRPCLAEQDELVLVSAHWEGIKREFEWAFTEEWRAKTGREVRLRWLDIGGTSDIVKYLRSQYKRDDKRVGVDLLFSGGVDVFLELARDQILQPVKLDSKILAAIPPGIAGVPLYSPKGEWFSAALSTFGIVYNKVAVARLGLPTPTTWADLAKPEYFDLVGAGDPRKSGSMHAMYEIVLQGYGWRDGWQLLQRISGNVRNFSGGASQIGKEVASAEMVYGIAIDTYGGEILRRFGSDRIAFVVPSDYPAINGDGIAVLRNAPHPELAKAFIEFVLSEKGQRLFYAKLGQPGAPRRFEIGKLTVRPDLYGRVEPASVVAVNPFEWDAVVPYQAALAAQRWNLVNDLFGAFIIDVHDRLVGAAKSAGTGPSQLSGIPISEHDAALLMARGSWGDDSMLRSEKLQEWGELARRQGFLEPSTAVTLAWVPSALLGVLLLFGLVRRIRRNAGR